MKICLFTDTLGDLNGVSRFIQDMGEQAHAHGVELHIITSTSKPIPQHSYIHNLPYLFKIPMPFYQELDLVLPKKRAIKQLLQELQPDIVHISTPGPFGWSAKTIAQKMNFPLIGTYHTDFPAYLYDLTQSKWIKRQTDKIMAKFYRPFKHVISRSQHYIHVMDNDLGIAPSRTSVLPAGTDLQKFHSRHQDYTIWQHFHLANGRQKVLYVGRINIEKNIPFLLEVWQSFIEANPGIEADLVMAGEGRYRKLADKMKPYHAYFLGPVTGEALSKIYASSDLFIFPSTTDTLGQVIMEAQASGLGCLVSDQGGPQSLLPDQAGFIIAANDAEAWQKKLADLLSEQVSTHNWAQCTRQHMQQYDIQDSFQHFINIHKAQLQETSSD